jgi:hypothetical protein
LPKIEREERRLSEREERRLSERERKGEGEGRVRRHCRFKFGANFFFPVGYVSNSILFYNKNEKEKKRHVMCHVGGDGM